MTSFTDIYPVPTAMMSNHELLCEADRLEREYDMVELTEGNTHERFRYGFVKRELSARAAKGQI